MKYEEKNVIYNDKDIIKVDASIIPALKKLAKKNINKRARLCLHENPQDLLHEMVIALCQDCYIRPHKHTKKSESFHIIEGKLHLFIFDNDGKVIEHFEMGEKSKSSYFLYRIVPNYWHTVISISDIVIFHETTNGPFTGGVNDSTFPDWAPEETDEEEVKKYLKGLMRLVV